MNGIDSDEEDNDDSKNRPAQGDDLDDGLSYNYDEEEVMPLTYKDGKLINQDIAFSRKRKAKDEEDEEISDESEDEDDNEDEDEEDENDENDETDNEDILGDEIVEVNENLSENNESKDEKISNIDETIKKNIIQDENIKKEIEQRRKKRSEQAKNELGYVFSIPETHGKFLELISEKSIDDQMTIIRRIRILYNVKIHPQNKDKLTVYKYIIIIFTILNELYIIYMLNYQYL